MDHQFYIDTDSGRTGPFDLLVMMKKIRARTVLSDTIVYSDPHSDGTPARQIPELAMFFHTETVKTLSESRKQTATGLFIQYMKNGWNSLNTHIDAAFLVSICTILQLLISYISYTLLPLSMAYPVAIFTFFINYTIFSVISLRLSRGEHIAALNIKENLLPYLPLLILVAILLSFIFGVGLWIVILPGILLITLYGFAPFFIQDHKLSPFEALQASRTIVGRLQVEYFAALFGIHALLFISAMLILPLPVVMPAALMALADCYDQTAH